MCQPLSLCGLHFKLPLLLHIVSHNHIVYNSLLPITFLHISSYLSSGDKALFEKLYRLFAFL